MPVIRSRTGFKWDYCATASEYIALPRNTMKGQVGCVSFLDMGFNANVDLVGREDMPLVSPFVIADGEEITRSADFRLEKYWIPVYGFSGSEVSASLRLITPITRKGFICRLEVKNAGSRTVKAECGFRGAFKDILLTSKALTRLKCDKLITIPSREKNMVLLKGEREDTLFAMCLLNGSELDAEVSVCDLQMSGDPRDSLDYCYEMSIETELAPGESFVLPLYAGIGKKDISAVSAARELMYQGADRLEDNLKKWLDRHIIHCGGDEELKRLVNENSFYNFFYSQGVTLDTEEMAIVSARDSKSSACGVYTDDDSLLRSIFGVKQISQSQARKHLQYAFGIQAENVGVLSRTINGRVLEPGMKLDSICAPIRALQDYIETTGDLSILYLNDIQDHVSYVQDILGTQYHGMDYIMETLYDVSGNYTQYPYLCVQNVLAWKILTDISMLYNRIRDLDRSKEAMNVADSLKLAIMKSFVFEGADGPQFAWAVDMEGGYIFDDDPSLSLLMLPFWGFCEKNDPVFLNTRKFIAGLRSREPKNMKNEINTLINSALCGDKDTAEGIMKGWIKKAAETGGEELGADPHASLCGILAFALKMLYGDRLRMPGASALFQKTPTESLFHKSPTVKLNYKKARV
ncbi:MAG: glycoside hydrolase family 125 protein [Abditibacteriota bacterium]|nr:glycoside hydrolase family 125 protein [Abditibacteriota bacterium]